MTSKKDVTEAAKDIRKVLKANWPECRFSVRSERYAGGSSVYITWTDVPTQTQVEQVTACCKSTIATTSSPARPPAAK